MIDISSFVLRWLFLSNLCRDISEIQTLPSVSKNNILQPSSSVQPNNNDYHPNDYYHQQQQQQQQQAPILPTDQRHLLPQNQNMIVDNPTIHHPTDDGLPSPSQPFVSSHHPNPISQSHERQTTQQQQGPPFHPTQQKHIRPQQQQQQHWYSNNGSGPQRQQPPSTTSTATNHHHHNNHNNNKLLSRDIELEYKEHCWKNILSFPTHCSERNRVINELRTQLVQRLQQRLQHDTHIVQQYNSQQQINNNDATSMSPTMTVPSSDHDRRNTDDDRMEQNDNNNNNSKVSLHDYIIAKRSLLLFRNYLPQLVSVVLKSPPPLNVGTASSSSTTASLSTTNSDTTTTTTTVVVQASTTTTINNRDNNNPIQQLRHILLSHCVHDASIGIELCWLLEAEVGRAWKTLFEHRRQPSSSTSGNSGLRLRRLIIVLPADKAMIIAKIGIEKQEAFDLLQDAEQATAFGYTDSSDPILEGPTSTNSNNNHAMVEDHITRNARLPSSLSVRRCSHFGDAMQLIDRLSKISSDLRMIPTPYRYNVLHDHLHELNRRLRRRMVSRGDISIDVDDNRSPYDWPQIEDMSLDMIVHSVHLPLIPQRGLWCNGENENDSTENISSDSWIPNTEVVRVLNIVVHESKLLSSRERCPFLIHVEVADSGLEGNDARLYTTGTADVGSTIGEALGMMNYGFESNISKTTETSPLTDNHVNIPNRIPPRNFIPYSVPDELLHHPVPATASAVIGETADEHYDQGVFLRGGSQSESPFYDGPDVIPGGYMIDPFDLVRQQDYEQLHHQLQLQRTFESVSPIIPPTVQKLSVGGELLDNVFGREWRDKCKEIRDSSPYGHVKGWRLASFIMKAGEDIRRESFVMQIISKLQSWFKEEIPEADRPFMRPYTIMCVGGDAGLLECLSDAKSVDEVKKRTDEFTSLRDYFERAYGPPRRPAFIPPSNVHNDYDKHKPVLDPFGLSKLATGSSGHVSFETAQDNFLRSLVGYSLVCYILQIKDRHNANILLDRLGHVMHIDFGYVLGDTPKMGKVPIFSERAPFKLSSDFWDVLGGWNVGAGGLGVKFCKMFELAFQCASSHADEIAALTEAAVLSLHSNPRHARSLANGVRSRLRMRGGSGSREQKMFIMELVNAALTSWGTSTYDWLQRNMNGYQ